MAIKKILRLGNPMLYRICEPVERDELPQMRDVVEDLHDTLASFRKSCAPARAIAAPQIAVFKRLIFLHVDVPVVYINPVLDEMSTDMVTLWDDCMSFPEILVRVRRNRTCRITYRDLNWNEHRETLSDFAELLQHEIDHLDGILAISRAIDSRSIILRSERSFVHGAAANN